MQHGATVIVRQPRLDQRFSLGWRALFVICVNAAVHRVGVVRIELHCPVEHGNAPAGAAGFDQGPAEGCEEPPVVAPCVGDAFEQFRLPGVEIVEAAETEQTVYPEGERQGDRVAGIGGGVFTNSAQGLARLAVQHEGDDVCVVALTCRQRCRQVASQRRMPACFPNVADRCQRSCLCAVREREVGVDGQCLVDQRPTSRLQCEQEVHRRVVEFHRA